MTESILLVNPRRKRRRKSTAKRARRRSSARVVRRRRRRNPIGAYMMGNPRRRHRSGGLRIRRRRRNPRFSLGGGKLSVGGVVKQLIPAAIGGAGAVGLDIAVAYLPIPDTYKTGWIGIAVKIAGAIGLGMVAGKVIGKEKARLITAGALTVMGYQIVKKFANDALPDSVKGLSGVADFDDLNLGAYMSPARALPAPRMGEYMNPAPYLQGLDGVSTGGDGYYGFDS